MSRRILFLLVWAIAWLGIFFWWMSTWPAQVVWIEQGEDILWRSIQKRDTSWERVIYSADKKEGLVSYQTKNIIMYGEGILPTIKDDKEIYTIEVPAWGRWIIRSLSQTQTITVKGSNMNIVMKWVWGMYISIDDVLVANFDADMTLSGTKILPSFYSRDGKIEFFDIGEKNEIIPEELWMIYLSFSPRDKERALWNISKKFLDSMIGSLIKREPEWKGSGIFRHDLRARNALEEIQSLVNKIDAGDSCGDDVSSCSKILADVFRREKDNFPEIFVPLEHAVQAWLQIDTQTEAGNSWMSIFRVYHAQILAADPRARVVRDKAILELIQSGTIVSSLEIWEYLTQMLASQKLGSAYSLQIVREMIRIGDSLQRSPDTDEETKKTLTKNAVDSLTNLKDILENTYFTKKEYWFVLRDDLVDDDGNAIKNQVFINDLQDLIKQIGGSGLILNPWAEYEEKLRIIRAQLAWFNCIFSRNEEYVGNPRICRTTSR